METAKKGVTERPVSKDVFLAVNNNRRLTYAFLSRIYEKEMTVDLLKEMRGGKNPVLKGDALVGIPDEEMRHGFETLGEYLKGLKDADLERARLELAVEYAILFLGVEGKLWHPSESAYRNKGHLLMQQPTDKVQHANWDAGVEAGKAFTEPPDHIATELQFMAYLCRRTGESVEAERGDEADAYARRQKDFLKDHLSVWTGPFAKKVLENAKTGFYRGTATITKRFVELDFAMVDDMLTEIKGL